MGHFLAVIPFNDKTKCAYKTALVCLMGFCGCRKSSIVSNVCSLHNDQRRMW